MSRPKSPKVPKPVPVDPKSIWTPDAVFNVLGVPVRAQAREIRRGNLRVSSRVNRHFYLGQWLIDWIDVGEVVRRAQGKAA